MKICAICNAENEDDTVFCTECGGKFPAAPEAQPAAPEPQPAAPEPHSGSLKFNDTYQINFSPQQQVIGRSELSATAKNLGASLYSFHSGFLFDPEINELGEILFSRNLFDHEKNALKLEVLMAAIASTESFT